MSLRCLSLFSGAGGESLATGRMLGWRHLGYVEYDDYCQRVLAQRMRDGHIDTAPIFGDIRSFNRDGYAARYRGLVDVVCGGFPCQPFSTAGARRGLEDTRNMWPATLATLRAVEPRWVYLENVPGLIAGASGDYFGTILSDLAALGYDVRWTVLGAYEVGARHKRDRLWIVGEQVANTHSERQP